MCAAAPNFMPKESFTLIAIINVIRNIWTTSSPDRSIPIHYWNRNSRTRFLSNMFWPSWPGHFRHRHTRHISKTAGDFENDRAEDSKYLERFSNKQTFYGFILELYGIARIAEYILTLNSRAARIRILFSNENRITMEGRSFFQKVCLLLQAIL